jgi:hypothetical protein
MRIRPPLCCNHITASDWLCVFDVDMPDGKISLHREPVIAFRIETFQIDREGGFDRFDTLTPILASGSVSDVSLYVLQHGSVYFTGDERLDSAEDAMAWFQRQRSSGVRGK